MQGLGGFSFSANCKVYSKPHIKLGPGVRPNSAGFPTPRGSYPTPFLGRLLFKITDPKHKTRYPKKGVGYEPPGTVLLRFRLLGFQLLGLYCGAWVQFTGALGLGRLKEVSIGFQGLGFRVRSAKFRA